MVDIVLIKIIEVIKLKFTRQMDFISYFTSNCEMLLTNK